jgi:hypothetical protein
VRPRLRPQLRAAARRGPAVGHPDPPGGRRAYLGGSAPDALEQTVETDEDAELDAQLEQAVHDHDAPGGQHQVEEPDLLDPPTDEIPVVPVAAADVEPVRPRRRRVPRTPAAGSEVVSSTTVVQDAPGEVTDDATETVLSPARPARPRRTRKDQP